MADLVLSDVTLSFGGVRAVNNLSMRVDEGAITALIGPNGAGKTSVLNVISRLYQPEQGTVNYGEVNLLSRRPHQVVAAGITRSFQNVALFSDLSVLDNLKVGVDHGGRAGLVRNIVRTPSARRHERQAGEQAWQALEFLGITALADRKAGELAFGQQKLVDLGRALVGHPRLILLDEPAAGTPEALRDRLGELIRDIPSSYGASVLLIDHDMPLVLGVSTHVIVMEFGIKIADGPPVEIRSDPRVLAAYLGED